MHPPYDAFVIFTGRCEFLRQEPVPSSLSSSYPSPPTIARLRSRVFASSHRPIRTRSLYVMAEHTGEPSSSLVSEEIPTSVSPSLALTSAVSSPLLVQETSQPLYLEQGSTPVDLELVTESTPVTTTQAPRASPFVPSVDTPLLTSV